MSTVNLEPEGEPIELSISASDLTEYHQAVATFDEANEAFLDAAAELFVEPNSELFINDLATSTANVVLKFAECVKQLHVETTDEEERTANILQLMLGEEEKHLAIFSQLAECDEWQDDAYERSDVEDLIEAIYANVEGERAVQAALVGGFSDGLEADVKHFLEHASELASKKEAEAANKVSLKRKIGNHVLDVAKIGVGVAIGVLAAQRLGKR